MKYLLISILFFFTACSNTENQTDKSSKKEVTTTIYLVRHAEKATGENPELTEAGEQRAKDLADFLKDKNINEVFSTDYRRTQQTTAPTAKQFSRGIGSYSPNNLEEFAQKLKKHQDKILVVGHSNTTPELVKILGGDPGEPIVEAWEYDRIYVLKFEKDKLISSELLRFGEPSKP